jgi:hypothetical protein
MLPENAKWFVDNRPKNGENHAELVDGGVVGYGFTRLAAGEEIPASGGIPDFEVSDVSTLFPEGGAVGDLFYFRLRHRGEEEWFQGRVSSVPLKTVEVTKRGSDFGMSEFGFNTNTAGYQIFLLVGKPTPDQDPASPEKFFVTGRIPTLYLATYNGINDGVGGVYGDWDMEAPEPEWVFVYGDSDNPYNETLTMYGDGDIISHAKVRFLGAVIDVAGDGYDDGGYRYIDIHNMRTGKSVTRATVIRNTAGGSSTTFNKCSFYCESACYIDRNQDQVVNFIDCAMFTTESVFSANNNANDDTINLYNVSINTALAVHGGGGNNLTINMYSSDINGTKMYEGTAAGGSPQLTVRADQYTNINGNLDLNDAADPLYVYEDIDGVGNPATRLSGQHVDLLSGSFSLNAGSTMGPDAVDSALYGQFDPVRPNRPHRRGTNSFMSVFASFEFAFTKMSGSTFTYSGIKGNTLNASISSVGLQQVLSTATLGYVGETGIKGVCVHPGNTGVTKFTFDIVDEDLIAIQASDEWYQQPLESIVVRTNASYEIEAPFVWDFYPKRPFTTGAFFDYDIGLIRTDSMADAVILSTHPMYLDPTNKGAFRILEINASAIEELMFPAGANAVLDADISDYTRTWQVKGDIALGADGLWLGVPAGLSYNQSSGAVDVTDGNIATVTQGQHINEDWNAVQFFFTLNRRGA